MLPDVARLSPVEHARRAWITAYDVYLAVRYERLGSHLTCTQLFDESERLHRAYQDALKYENRIRIYKQVTAIDGRSVDLDDDGARRLVEALGVSGQGQAIDRPEIEAPVAFGGIVASVRRVR